MPGYANEPDEAEHTHNAVCCVDGKCEDVNTPKQPDHSRQLAAYVPFVRYNAAN